MNWNMKKVWPTAAISIAAFTAMLNADQSRDGYKHNKGQNNGPAMRCDRFGVCGPEMPYAVNPPARPFTDDACCCMEGEFSVTLAGFYWQATEDGLEYAVTSSVTLPTATGAGSLASLTGIIDATYQTPDPKWKPGFKVGLGYNSTHDGWDFEVIWTHFNGRMNSDNDNETDQNIALLPLWSAYAPLIAAGNDTNGEILYATLADASWRLDLNMVDLELGREFWVSRMMTVRPHIGFRVAQINQRYGIMYNGGIFDSPAGATATIGAVNDEITMKNHFTGGGARAGLDTVFNFGCCDPCSGNFGLFGNLALSAVYGKFQIEQEEYLESPIAPAFSQTPVMTSEEHLRAVRGILDVAVGIQYASLFNDQNYGVVFQLAWEFHQFFNQNQLWRVTRIGDGGTTALHGENVFNHSRGDLSTQGVTVTARITF